MRWLRRQETPTGSLGLTGPVSTTSFAGLPPTVGPSSNAVGGTGIVSAAAPTTFTLYTTTETELFPGTDGGASFRSTVTSTIAITNAASYAALTASLAAEATSTTAIPPTSPTTTAAQATSTASHKSSSSNMNTLIPAIVVPVAVVLLSAFGLFWFFMRRRHHQALKRASFVMAAKEKLSTTSPSTRSKSSSVNGKGSPRKIPANTAAQPLSPPQHPISPPPAYTSPTEGSSLAQVLASQGDHRRHLPPRSDSAQGSFSSPRSPHVAEYTSEHPRNFIDPNPGPRPGTAGSRRPPPNPSVQNRSRSRSSPGDRRAPSPGYPAGGMRPHRPAPRPPRDPRGPRGVPGPGPRPGPGPVPYTKPTDQYTRPPGPSQQPRPGAPPKGFSANNVNKANISPSNSTRAPPPPPINLPPVGAFNGAGPISQYSPIVKEMPRKPAPNGLELQTSDLDNFQSSSHSDGLSSARSPDGGLHDENVHSLVTGSGLHGSPISAKNPKSPNVGWLPPRAEGATNSGQGHRPRVSTVSALSDIELPLQREPRIEHGEEDDDKSDVSSLHEEERQALERFDFDDWGGDFFQRVSRDGGRPPMR